MTPLARDRRVWLGAGLAVWALILWMQFGGAEAKSLDAVAAAQITPAVAPTEGDVSHTGAAADGGPLIAGPAQRELQLRAAELPLGPNPFRTLAPRTEQRAPSPGATTPIAAAPALELTSIIGDIAIINGLRVRAGDVIPGTAARLVRIERGRVQVETDGGILFIEVRAFRTKTGSGPPERGASSPERTRNG